MHNNTLYYFDASFEMQYQKNVLKIDNTTKPDKVYKSSKSI